MDLDYTLSPIAAVSGVLAHVVPDDVLGWYMTVITVVCGSISVVRLIYRLYTVIRDRVRKKKTTAETIAAVDEIVQEMEVLKDDLNRDD